MSTLDLEGSEEVGPAARRRGRGGDGKSTLWAQEAHGTCSPVPLGLRVDHSQATPGILRRRGELKELHAVQASSSRLQGVKPLL